MSEGSFLFFMFLCFLIALLLDGEGGGGKRARLPVRQ